MFCVCSSVNVAVALKTLFMEGKMHVPLSVSVKNFSRSNIFLKLPIFLFMNRLELSLKTLTYFLSRYEDLLRACINTKLCVHHLEKCYYLEMKLLVSAEERGCECVSAIAGSREENVSLEQLVYFIAG